MWKCSQSDFEEEIIILKTKGEAILIRIYATHDVEFKQSESPFVKFRNIEDYTLKLTHVFRCFDKEIHYELFHYEQCQVCCTVNPVNFENAFATAKQMYRDKLALITSE
jgi:hypothetical protein